MKIVLLLLSAALSIASATAALHLRGADLEGADPEVRAESRSSTRRTFEDTHNASNLTWPDLTGDCDRTRSCQTAVLCRLAAEVTVTITATNSMEG